MERSESIKQIAVALCQFQGKVGKIKKEASNPFFKSKYATLANILDVIHEPLNECGLSIIQLPTGECELQTIIMHQSGEYISSTYMMRPVDNKPQTLGSCITYQRRYALGAALSLNIDDDDDGNKASGKEEKKEKQEQLAKKLADDQRLNLFVEYKKQPAFMSRIYKNEVDAKQNGEAFNMKDFLTPYYKFTDGEFNMFLDDYANYKKTNNLN